MSRIPSTFMPKKLVTNDLERMSAENPRHADENVEELVNAAAF